MPTNNETHRLVIAPPEISEYSPYYGKYISLVAGDDIVTTLQHQINHSGRLLMAVSEERGDYRYAPEKWSVREVLGHVIDTERIFAYRTLRISRGDATPIEGFEQDDYVRNGPFGRCRVTELVQEFAYVRETTVFLFRSLDEGAWLRRGVANKSEVSVRALAYIIAGHEIHHRKILQEKYLLNPT